MNRGWIGDCSISWGLNLSPRKMGQTWMAMAHGPGSFDVEAPKHACPMHGAEELVGFYGWLEFYEWTIWLDLCWVYVGWVNLCQPHLGYSGYLPGLDEVSFWPLEGLIWCSFWPFEKLGCLLPNTCDWWCLKINKSAAVDTWFQGIAIISSGVVCFLNLYEFVNFVNKELSSKIHMWTDVNEVVVVRLAFA